MNEEPTRFGSELSTFGDYRVSMKRIGAVCKDESVQVFECRYAIYQGDTLLWKGDLMLNKLHEERGASALLYKLIDEETQSNWSKEQNELFQEKLYEIERMANYFEEDEDFLS